MSLFNVKDAVEGATAKRAAKTPVQAPKGTSMRPSSDRLAHMETQLKAAVERIKALEGFRSDQLEFNAGTVDRVGQIQRSELPCPGCGNPCDTGMHGVWCFQVADGG